MSGKPTLVLIIPTMSAGGAERVMSILANGLVARGWPVTLLTVSGEEQPSFYPLRDEIRRRHCDLSAPYGAKWKIFSELRERSGKLREILKEENAGATLAFMDTANVLSLLATRGTKIPSIVSVRCHPNYVPVPKGWGELSRLTFRRAATVVCQTPDVVEVYPPAVQKRCVVISNPVRPPKPVAGVTREKMILGMGRLDVQKGFDMLIQAFSQVAAKHPDWHVEIFGKGGERDSLQALIDELGLGERVKLAGLTSQPENEMARAGIFALSSRFEGFPNVLCEAMAQGCPSVSFDCPSGPSVIIRHEKDGLLVPRDDVAGLASALDRMMADAALRDRVGAEAKTVADRFSEPQILNEWEQVIQRAVSR